MTDIRSQVEIEIHKDMCIQKGLNDLPDEIIYYIIGYLYMEEQYEEIAMLGFTSKKMYHLCTEYMRRMINKEYKTDICDGKPLSEILKFLKSYYQCVEQDYEKMKEYYLIAIQKGN